MDAIELYNINHQLIKQLKAELRNDKQTLWHNQQILHKMKITLKELK